VLQAAREAFSFLDGGVVVLARRVAERASSVQPEIVLQKQGLEKQIETARRSFDASRRALDVPRIEAATRTAQAIRTELDKLVASFGPPTIVDRGVHTDLREASRLFFAGDYASTLSVLDRVPSDIPLQLHAHLFRAAALLALYQRSGGKDDSLRARAQVEVDQCKQLDPAFAPDSGMFPPRFIAFYRGTAPEVTPASRANRP
jgi:hypothetical protein